MRDKRKQLEAHLNTFQEKRLGMPLILVVDDDVDLLEELKDILASHYNVVISAEGKEAYETALKLRPDLIITDLRMRPMSGFQLIEALHKAEKTKDIPILAMTGYYSKEGDKMIMHLGVGRLFLKPFRPSDLMARIEEILKERSSHKPPPK